MTDYANLNHPLNFDTKNEVKRLINLFNSNNIHYWCDFAFLDKITTETDNKFYFYLNSVELSLFEKDFELATSLLKDYRFNIWERLNFKICLATPNCNILKPMAERIIPLEPIMERMVKWINIWKYKDYTNNLVSIGIENDFLINREIFESTTEVEYCDIVFKVPKNYELLKSITSRNKTGQNTCHAPKKREGGEKYFSGANIGDYK
jgi:hypothetical protein